MRSLGWILLVCVLRTVIGCAGGSSATSTVSGVQLTAESVRDECVTRSLAVLQIAADLGAALPQLRDLEALRAHAAREGCRIDGPDAEGAYVMICTSRFVDDHNLGMRLQLRYFAGTAQVTPGSADRVVVSVQAGTNFMQCTGDLEFTYDADRGTMLRGELASRYFEGCTLDISGDGLTMQLVADLPGGRTGATFTEGRLDLDLTFEDRGDVAGSAALYGRRAVIALHIDGVPTTGEVALD